MIMIMTDILDDITDEELGFEEEEITVPIEENEEEVKDFFEDTGTSKETESSALSEFLESKGIKDSAIKILGEDDVEEEVKFEELPKEEQLAILNSLVEAPEKTVETPTEFSETDVKFLQELKEKDITLEKYLEDYKDTIIKETVPDQAYEIDNYDDQELYLLDLKNRFSELSDEELVAELEKELENGDRFQKKVTSLRSEYKKLEEDYNENLKATSIKEQEESYNEFTNTMVDTAIKSSEFYGIELEEAEKNEVLSYILDLDENGTSDFYKDLNSPERIYEAAWFLKYGKEAFDAVRGAYETEITKMKKDKPKIVHKEKKEEQDFYDLEY